MQTCDLKLSKRFVGSYGAWSTVATFLVPIELLQFQHLNKWMYLRGVPRLSFNFRVVANVYFPYWGDLVEVVVSRGRYEVNKLKTINNADWVSVQLGQHIFQVHEFNGTSRLLEKARIIIDKAPLR